MTAKERRQEGERRFRTLMDTLDACSQAQTKYAGMTLQEFWANRATVYDAEARWAVNLIREIGDCGCRFCKAWLEQLCLTSDQSEDLYRLFNLDPAMQLPDYILKIWGEPEL